PGASTATKARVSSVLSRVFLPEGWPDSVRPEYLQYQRWDTLQALCSYLRGILTTTAILEASGVGRESASPLAAAVAWVMRDGFGMLGSLVFAFAVGGQFDAAVKEWRLFADLINDVGLTLDMLAPLFPAHFVLVTSLGECCSLATCCPPCVNIYQTPSGAATTHS
ncbi:root UVB sensitive family, partial [Pavlovales sp. CCMP2436]